MKKKGFTLVELIAVMAITSVVILSVGGLYVTGIKKAQTTKINNDIENAYRNTYQLIKNQIEDSDKVISLKVDNNTKALGKEFKINEKPKELQGLTEDKAYILTKDSNSNIDTILASFRKNDSDELNLYILYMNNTNIDENEIKQNKDILNLKNISRVREVCDNLEKINITEADNGFNFKLDYLKNNIQRNYEFYISKDSKIVTISNNLDGSSFNNEFDNFRTRIGSLTVLDAPMNFPSIKITKKTRIELNDLKYKNKGEIKSPSFYLNNFPAKSNKKLEEIIKDENKNVINGKNDFIFSENLKNNNTDNNNLKVLDLKFAQGDVEINGEFNKSYLGESISKLEDKGDFILINYKKDKIYNINDIDKDVYNIKNIDKNIESKINKAIGVIIKESAGKIIILVNGNLTIESLGEVNKKQKNNSLTAKYLKGEDIITNPNYMLIYSNGTLNITGRNNFVLFTSLIAAKQIKINGNLVLNGCYAVTPSNKDNGNLNTTKNSILKFLK